MDIATLENVSQYDLSENQKNLWQIGNERLSEFYNQATLKFRNGIATEQLRIIIQKIVGEHEMLNFKTIKDVNYKYPFQGESIDAIDLLEVNEEALDENFLEAFEEKYDSEKNQAIQFLAVTSNGEVTCLYVRIYALWGDLYSTVRFLNELVGALSNEGIIDQEEVEKIGYLKYSNWQNELLEDPEVEAVKFWKTYKYDLQKKTFPILNDNEQLFRGAKVQVISFKDENYNALKEYCTSNGVRIEDLFMYEWGQYLGTFTEGDITLGYIPYKRNYEELDNTLGYVNNTIPVVFNNINSLNKVEAIKELRNTIESVLEWSDFFSLDRDASSNTQKQIFRDCFEYIDIKKSTSFDNTVVQDIYSVQDVFDLKLSCIDNGSEVLVELYFNVSKVNGDEIKIIQSQLQNQFSLLHEKKEKSIGLTIFEQEVIHTSNDTEEDISQNESVITLFKKQVENHPDHPAIVFNNNTITYKELDEKTDQLASYLQSKDGVEGNLPVCVLSDRSEWFVISILSILKAGLYYIPIDEDYPKDRISFILNDCDCNTILCNSELAEKYDIDLLNIIDPTDPVIYEGKKEEITVLNDKDDIAYCIYTSGSTGQPKGCLISNENLYNYITWANGYYYKNTDLGNFGFVTSISFDLTVTSLFTPLTRGKSIYVYNENTIVDTLKKAFENPAIDTLKLTPTHLSLIPELGIQETAIEIIICGGEALTTNHLDSISQVNSNILLFNEYGPTEATVGCVVKQIDLNWDGKITIGKPIANTSITILDEAQKLCHIGIVGEIMISGYGLSKGYLNREKLTSERFIESPFEDGQLMYKTGDVGRWLPNGEIEFISRIDDQVKVKGHRIELKEIEACLLSVADIKKTTVLISGKGLEKEIIAFLVTSLQQNDQELREYLKEKIPSYMIPNNFIELEAFPLTPNGKIDKQSLLELKNEYANPTIEYVAPESDIEIKLVKIWEEILKREKIGILDDFFIAGGDSIKAVRIISEVQKTFDVHIDVTTLFNEFNIRGLSEVIANKLWHDLQSKKEEFVDKIVI